MALLSVYLNLSGCSDRTRAPSTTRSSWRCPHPSLIGIGPQDPPQPTCVGLCSQEHIHKTHKAPNACRQLLPHRFPSLERHPSPPHSALRVSNSNIQTPQKTCSKSLQPHHYTAARSIPVVHLPPFGRWRSMPTALAQSCLLTPPPPRAPAVPPSPPPTPQGTDPLVAHTLLYPPPTALPTPPPHPLRAAAPPLPAMARVACPALPPPSHSPDPVPPQPPHPQMTVPTPPPPHLRPPPWSGPPTDPPGGGAAPGSRRGRVGVHGEGCLCGGGKRRTTRRRWEDGRRGKMAGKGVVYDVD